MNGFQGEERRKSIFTQADLEVLFALSRGKEFRFFGFRIQELFVIATVSFGIFAFYIRTNETLAGLDKFRAYTTDFMANSDAYHSDVLGVYFRQGKPLDENFNSQRIRDILNGSNHESGNVKTGRIAS